VIQVFRTKKKLYSLKLCPHQHYNSWSQQQQKFYGQKN